MYIHPQWQMGLFGQKDYGLQDTKRCVHAAWSKYSFHSCPWLNAQNMRPILDNSILEKLRRPVGHFTNLFKVSFQYCSPVIILKVPLTKCNIFGLWTMHFSYTNTQIQIALSVDKKRI